MLTEEDKLYLVKNWISPKEHFPTALSSYDFALMIKMLHFLYECKETELKVGENIDE